MDEARAVEMAIGLGSQGARYKLEYRAWLLLRAATARPVEFVEERMALERKRFGGTRSVSTFDRIGEGYLLGGLPWVVDVPQPGDTPSRSETRVLETALVGREPARLFAELVAAKAVMAPDGREVYVRTIASGTFSHPTDEGYERGVLNAERLVGGPLDL